MSAINKLKIIKHKQQDWKTIEMHFLRMSDSPFVFPNQLGVSRVLELRAGASLDPALPGLDVSVSPAAPHLDVWLGETRQDWQVGTIHLINDGCFDITLNGQVKRIKHIIDRWIRSIITGF